MSPVEMLAALAGTWRGTSTLQDPNTGKPDESPSTLTVMPVLAGRFVRLDYTWVYRQKPQEGSLLIGFDDPSQAVSAYWIDSWHMGNKAMTCGGTANEPGVSVRGTYAAPPGPDWGWRIDVVPEHDGLRVVMFNIYPVEDGGKEELAVTANYVRA